MIYERTRTDGMHRSHYGRFYYKPTVEAVTKHIEEDGPWGVSGEGLIIIFTSDDHAADFIVTDVNAKEVTIKHRPLTTLIKEAVEG